MLTKILLVLSFVVGLFAVLVYQSTQLPSRQLKPEQFSVDEQLVAKFSKDFQLTRAADNLAKALRIKTVSYQSGVVTYPENFLAMHTFILDAYPLLHSRLKREIINEYSLFYTWQGSNSALKPYLLMSHLDVVPAEPDTAQWSYEPFAGFVDEGYLYGRGAIDVKIGVIAILEAIEMLVKQGFQPKRTIYLSFGHDEEVSGAFGSGKVAEMLKARGISLEYIIDEGGVVTNGIVPDIDQPIALVAVGEKGYLTLELTVQGKGGHSSMPEVPQTSVGILSGAIERLEKNQMAQHLDGFNGMIDFLGSEFPFAKRLVFANQWLFAGVMASQLAKKTSTNAATRTTIAPTMLEGSVKENVLPVKTSAVVNFRIMQGDTIDSVVAHVERAIADPRVHVAFLNTSNFRSEPSPLSPTNSPQFMLLHKTIRQVRPDALVAPNVAVGATDARYFYKVTPNVFRFIPYELGPSDLSRMHGINERIRVSDIEVCARFFYLMVHNTETQLSV